MSPEEAEQLGLKPFGDGGAENETSPPPDEETDRRAHFGSYRWVFGAIVYRVFGGGHA